MAVQELPGKPITTEKPKPPKLTREMIFLAEQAAEGKLKVLPAKEWALHYPVDQQARAQLLAGLLAGEKETSEVAQAIKPDALLYAAEDIAKDGLEKVSARIRDLSAYITHFDYPRFAKFIASMRGREIPLDELDNLYRGINQTRVQKKMLDAYGATGKKQMERALASEVQAIIANIGDQSRAQKVLQSLKVNWLSEDLGVAASEESNRLVSELSGDERQLFEQLQDHYRKYIQKGDEKAYTNLVNIISSDLPKIIQEPEKGQPSESMQELQKELEPFKDKVVPPQSPQDPAIPPDDQDEYHTPPPQSGLSKEKMEEQPIFEIVPPLGGYYISGRKSYFDVQTKTWSKKKKLQFYQTALSGKERTTISGNLDVGLKSLPLPNGYAVDASSLKGSNVEILRDQNGCFYLQAKGSGSFSLDFLKEPKLLINPPIVEDTAVLYKGKLSPKTETAISRLIGSALQKAEQARQYLLANHFYPGGGDLQMAQALQYKLRSESTGDNYLQNLDQSEYLECYSANTLFISMMRQAGIPARLVVGHKVEGAKKGKLAITQQTGHAWAEVWDGKAWRRFDATPKAKPEDKKESDQDNEQKDSAEEAEDGGIDKPQEQSSQQGQGQQQKQNGQKGKGQKQESESDQQGQESEGQEGQDQQGQKQPSESKSPLDQMSDADNNEVQQGEAQMKQAQEQMDKVNKEKKELDKKIKEAEKFKDLEQLQKEIEQSELFDDFKKELEKKLEAKEEEMKDAIKENLDQMTEDGFMDEDRREKLEKEIEDRGLAELDKMQEQIGKENRLYNEYDDIRQEVMPLVEQWFKYFAERLPHQDEVEFDEDSLTRQGAFNRKSVMKVRNLIFGTVKNPRQIRPSIRPKFMGSIVVDVSGSMQGDKLKSARKLLIFYSELFARISQAFGYIKFSINIFSDSVVPIKNFEQDYDAPTRYDFEDKTSSTVKVRLMQKLVTKGGTNMLAGITKAAKDLNKETEDFPDYASALYLVGDGGDTYGNANNIKEFLKINEAEQGFGQHMYSAILLGNESARQELAGIFGDEHTNVAPDFDELIEKSMVKFDEDIEGYLQDKTV